MKTQSYRHNLEIIASILEECRSPRIISEISRHTNLSHDAASRRTRLLTANGLLELKASVRKKGHSGNPKHVREYLITQKGMEILQRYDRLKELLRVGFSD
ncbi:MAG: hypothetical protein KGH98_02215 [Candidatus Micrarchaeota archaeon]|nr:hypothetical protein [Candidatus Micrarchaeota archaeon]